MTLSLLQTKDFARILRLVLTLGLFASIGRAGAQGQTPQNPQPSKNDVPTLRPVQGDAAPAVPAAPVLNAQEEADYKAFFDVSLQDSDKKLQMGEDFVQKYPASRYIEGVYAALVQVYVAKQDWDKFYADADKALALNPDDTSVLTTVGWVIPHTYNASDPHAADKLTKAETYEKHAIDVIGTLPKPDGMTDDQFAAAKTQNLAEAHSGLGLVYFRRQQFDDSAKELTQATQAAIHPDPTDLFVLGIDLQSLKQNAQAADAFDHCAQTPGGLQAECKRRSDALKQAK